MGSHATRRRERGGTLGANGQGIAPSRGRKYSLLVASVLVVDDERDIRTAVAEILADEGYQVLDASDGAEALDKVRAFRPQLILLDLMMPRMNGWEFRAAQQGDPDPAVAKVPVIVLSALALGRTGMLDAEGYLRKPFDLDELLRAVKRHAA